MKSTPFLDNGVVIDVLQRMLFSETKPSKVRPIDLSVMTYLLMRRCADHSIFDSHQTIAERVCAERKAVRESLARLDDVGWISLGGRGKGRSKAVCVDLEAFPAAQPIRDKITEEAKALVREYVSELQKAGRRKFPKQWTTRQYPSAQRILTKCGGDVNLAYRMMGFAFMHPDFRKRARMSVYHMLCIWPKIAKAYGERIQQVAELQKGTNEISDVQRCAAA